MVHVSERRKISFFKEKISKFYQISKFFEIRLYQKKKKKVGFIQSSFWWNEFWYRCQNVKNFNVSKKYISSRLHMHEDTHACTTNVQSMCLYTAILTAMLAWWLVTELCEWGMLTMMVISNQLFYWSVVSQWQTSYHFRAIREAIWLAEGKLSNEVR